LVAISNTGNVIRDDTVASINPACETVVRGPFTYTLNADGTTTATTAPAPNVAAQAGGKFLVRVGNDVYLSDSRCGLVNPVLVMSAVNNFNDAKMVEFGGNYYIAIRYNGTNLDYYRVTGTTRTPLYSNTNNPLRGNNSNLYDIDGVGYLYFNVRGNAAAAQNLCGNVATGNFNDNICVVTPAGNTLLQDNITGNNNAGDTANGILAFNDRVLAVATPNAGTATVYGVSITGAGAINVAANPAGADLTALQRCIGADTVDVNGRGTAVVRCVFDDNTGGGLQDRLSVFVHNGNGNYSSNTIRINNNSTNGPNAIGRDNIRFGANGVLVVTRDNGGNLGAGNGRLGPIYLCTTTTAPFNVSCSETDLPNPVGNLPIRDTTRVYPLTGLLKFNGNNVFYLSGTSPRVGNIFGTPQSLTTAVTAATGGNATFDLTKFAFSFRPVDAPPGCNTQVAFFSSTTAAPKFYTLSTPNTCVARILKVFP
jgi:hypothetical protein